MDPKTADQYAANSGDQFLVSTLLFPILNFTAVHRRRGLNRLIAGVHHRRVSKVGIGGNATDGAESDNRAQYL